MTTKDYIVGMVTDGASVIIKTGRLSGIIHQICHSHGLHLAVCDVLYKKRHNLEDTNEDEEALEYGVFETSDDENDDEYWCSVSRLALHRAAMPNIFLPFFIFLLVCFRRLSTLHPPLCVILVFTMCIHVLLLYVSKITLTYFDFLLGLDNVYFCLLMVAR